MRVVVIGLIALASIGCDRVVPNAAGADRSYRIGECANSLSGSTETSQPPCTAHVGGLTKTVVDSGRVVLKRDHTLTWMLASSSCVIAGSCSFAGVDTSSGTYEISGDTLLVKLQHAGSNGETNLVLTSSIPDRVSSDWAGPDFLTYNLSNQPYYATFRP